MAPHGLLNKSFPPADEAFAYNTKEKPGKLNVSLLQIVNVKGIHKSAVIRSTIRYRVKTAFAMITTRGADVVRNKEGVEEIILRDEDIGRHWIIPSTLSQSRQFVYSYLFQTGLTLRPQRWSSTACLILK